jgi:hypothetical protein
MAGNPVPPVAKLCEVTARHAHAPARMPYADALALDERQDAQEGVRRRHRHAHCQRHQLRHYARQKRVRRAASHSEALERANVGKQ